MDETVFDRWIRRLGESGTRQGVLRRAVGGAIVLTVGRFAGEAADADAKRRHANSNAKRKKRKQQKPQPAPTCPPGTFPLAGRCLRQCGEACFADGGNFCLASVDTKQDVCLLLTGTSCDELPTICAGHGDCDSEEICAGTTCGPNVTFQGRCAPFL